jgi:hypothetical protein
MTHSVVNIDSHDTLVSAMMDAETRAASVFGAKNKTLVDMIPHDAWESWDASAERPNVADCDQLDDEDEFDKDAEPIAA